MTGVLFFSEFCNLLLHVEYVGVVVFESLVKLADGLLTIGDAIEKQLVLHGNLVFELLELKARVVV